MTKQEPGVSKVSAGRVFGRMEIIFDVLYLAAASLLGILSFIKTDSPLRGLAALMAFVLVGGDLFHLAPRILSVTRGDETRWAAALGRGKQITSITMTVFYVLLWHYGLRAYGLSGYEGATGVLYALAAVRVLLCLPKGNEWVSPSPSFRWALIRNLPFIALGAMCAALYLDHAALLAPLACVGPAVILSFLFYLPVALWAGKNRKLGMLMLPKTLMYLWILLMIRASL